MVAVRGDIPELVDVLLKANADVNARDDYGATPLHKLAHKGNATILPLLIAAGAEINGLDNEGKTSLRVAAEYSDNPAFVVDLLTAGANPNSPDENGDTPLYISSFGKNENIPLLLIEHGADVHLRNDENESALFNAVKRGHKPLVTKMVAAGADVDSPNRYGKTPKMLAEKNRDQQLAAELVAILHPNVELNLNWQPDKRRNDSHPKP